MKAMAHFTPRNGPMLHVDDAGGDGLPVLFLHGLCGDAKQAAEAFPPDAEFRRITLEARGHGASEAGDATAFSIATFTDDVAQLITALNLGPLVVGGISMGAAIAMRLAVMRPELVRGLVIARPAWFTFAAPPNMQPNAEVGALLERLQGDSALAVFMETATAKRLAVEAPDNLASLKGFFSRLPRDVTSALLQRISADGPGVSETQLRNLRLPTLVIGHGRDSVHPLLLAQNIAHVIPGAVLAEITPKAVDRVRYVSEFQTAMRQFLKGFLP